MSYSCCGCAVKKLIGSFSKSQLQKKNPRCTECVTSKVPAQHVGVPHGIRFCSRKKHWLPLNGCAGTSLSCLDCTAAADARKKKVKENDAKRTPAHGACRVRDVQKRYGHLCEIPLQAYCEAGVASRLNDYVTEEDVERASNAWDARGIAHEIDTQWGAMPHGGAYSDSNHYYGPGEYDFF